MPYTVYVLCTQRLYTVKTFPSLPKKYVITVNLSRERTEQAEPNGQATGVFALSDFKMKRRVLQILKLVVQKVISQKYAFSGHLCVPAVERRE